MKMRRVSPILSILLLYLIFLITSGCGSDKLTYEELEELKADRDELLFKLLQERNKLQEKTKQLEEKIKQLDELKMERDKILQERDELQDKINQLDERIKLLEAPKSRIINVVPDESVTIYPQVDNTLTLIFNTPVEEVQAQEFTTDKSPDGITWTLKGHNLQTWVQHPRYAKGYLDVIVTWKNKDGSFGNKMIKLIINDVLPPKLISSSPKDGESGVDPAKVTKITVQFDEVIIPGRAKLTPIGGDNLQVKENRLRSHVSIFPEGKDLVVILLNGVKLDYETKYELTGTVQDFVGNEVSFKITFETMKRA